MHGKSHACTVCSISDEAMMYNARGLKRVAVELPVSQNLNASARNYPMGGAFVCLGTGLPIASC